MCASAQGICGIIMDHEVIGADSLYKLVATRTMSYGRNKLRVRHGLVDVHVEQLALAARPCKVDGGRQDLAWHTHRAKRVPSHASRVMLTATGRVLVLLTPPRVHPMGAYAQRSEAHTTVGLPAVRSIVRAHCVLIVLIACFVCACFLSNTDRPRRPRGLFGIARQRPSCGE